MSIPNVAFCASNTRTIFSQLLHNALFNSVIYTVTQRVVQFSHTVTQRVVQFSHIYCYTTCCSILGSHTLTQRVVQFSHTVTQCVVQCDCCIEDIS